MCQALARMIKHSGVCLVAGISIYRLHLAQTPNNYGAAASYIIRKKGEGMATRAKASKDNTEHRIGLVSDTHGRLHPAVKETLAGVELILHAGDVGKPEILEELAEIAPVVAVGGNVDMGVEGLDLPCFEVRDLFGLKILITHYTGEFEHLLPPVACTIDARKPDLVLSGHTHKPMVQQFNGIAFVNPGSCGPKRFSLPITCGMLTLRADRPKDFEVQLFDLEARRTLVQGA